MKTNAVLSGLILLEQRAGGHSVPSSFNSESSTLLPVPGQAKQSLGPPSSPRCHQANFVHWGQQIQNPEPNPSVRPMEMSETWKKTNALVPKFKGKNLCHQNQQYISNATFLNVIKK